MKPVAVLDSSVVVSGIGWRGGEARAVLRLLALRGFVSTRTPWLTAEWSETVERVAREEKRWRNENWRAWLDWLFRMFGRKPYRCQLCSTRFYTAL